MSAERTWPDDPGAPEHVLVNNEGFQRLVEGGGKLDTAAIIVTRSLEEAGFSITRWPVHYPECPMNFPTMCDLTNQGHYPSLSGSRDSHLSRVPIGRSLCRRRTGYLYRNGYGAR